jgi:glycosyltransferase involved in cell wall biosynthesis
VDVRFAGFQNQSALSRFYHAADLLVLPSRTAETWGLVVNEALHHGLPCVVSSRVGCGPDLVQSGRTGERATAGSAPELAAAVVKARVLAGRRDIRDACRDRAALYSLEPAAAGIARAYQDVIGVAAGAPSFAR